MLSMASKWETSEFGPPYKSGVYAIVRINFSTRERSILYIGSSRNISKRVLRPKHPYRMLIDSCVPPWVISIKYKVCDNYIEIERRLIQKLKPELNFQHSGKEYRSKFIRL